MHSLFMSFMAPIAPRSNQTLKSLMSSCRLVSGMGGLGCDILGIDGYCVDSIMESAFRRQEYGVKKVGHAAIFKEKSILHKVKWHRVILDEVSPSPATSVEEGYSCLLCHVCRRTISKTDPPTLPDLCSTYKATTNGRLLARLCKTVLASCIH